MKRKFKGFTLIECIVALAILGVSSLVMAQIYANVCKINRANHETNSSIAYQMKYVEQKDDKESVRISSGEKYADATNKKMYTDPPHERSITNILTVSSSKGVVVDASGTANKTDLNFQYSYPVDFFVLSSRDQNDEAAYEYVETSPGSGVFEWKKNTDYKGTRDEDYYLNYKYFTGYTKID